ncbi:glycosyltransferase family 39 protein [Deinococcus soli (ex Cha et al. 2016)]|uniref:Membrane protein n=2 Tax=Deinococcus soli (ex Cha et al. 2016) TaxID=1309411 RepID=A0AAE3XBX8_9DEIO|nr:glycosyltransferase family 39 protein [Deinococcus soli (ex Cha et al. 2016)]MDR6218471.1 putative membrane protein [Deinococcus soli (ex Cha et al. 2016)]MDR6329211.1 putative membrane protein [Deinococcus soli (ex Cha et al. 2016)]MDR6751484.1 putative membrane protein [Deinococcus soli (ex Cha et al. 2016)]
MIRNRPPLSTPLLAAAAAFLAALLLRTFHLDAQGFWFDEIFTANLTTFRTSLPDVLTYLKTNDAHPPLHYVLSWLWAHLVGAYGGAYPQVEAGLEWRMRLSSALTGACTAAVLTHVATKRYGLLAGAITAALMAVHPILVHQDQELRMYPLLTLLGVMSSLALQRALRSATRLHWGLYALSVTALLYTHYLAVFFLVAHAVLMLAERRALTRAAWLAVTPALLFAPWLPVLLGSLGQGRSAAAMRLSVETTMLFIVNSLSWYDANPMTAALRLTLMPLPWILAAIAWYVTTRPRAEDGQRDLSLLILTVVPLMSWYLASKYVTNLMSPRYAGFIMPFLLLSVAVGAAQLRTRWNMRAAPGLLALTLVGSSAAGLYYQYGTVMEPWREMAQVLSRQLRAGDEVALTDPSRALSLAYYLRPPEGVRLTDLRGATPEEMRALPHAPRLWLVTTRFPFGYGVPEETDFNAFLTSPAVRTVIPHSSSTLYFHQGDAP